MKQFVTTWHTIVAIFCLMAWVVPAHAERLTVAALHPVLGDMARQIGGEHVVVTDVMKPGANLHRFTPTPSDLVTISDAKVVLLMGKNIEPYCEKLQDSLRPDQVLLEVGKTIPSIAVHSHEGIFVANSHHGHEAGAIDPHWWQSVENMRRAVRVISRVFEEANPAGIAVYKANAKHADTRLNELQRWVKSQVATIPRAERKLATAHLAFSYFCEEFGFKAIGVQGLTSEQEPSVQSLLETIALLQRENVRAVFPEKSANPKVLARISAEAGVKIGGELDAAANASGDPVSYEAVVRHNVATIVQGLK